ncbi:hypothetical protein C1H46_043771 [Malus baccata]|uniref:CASP C-terminal domain-containing protein n=1 Tax=Malus baccata TaxID=106549 RepID=A0A540K9S3_MALBA|nr:hypothetical protein C1H46_043771 [Malus baccata]
MEDKVKEIVEIKQHSFAEENQKILEVLKEGEQLLQDQLRQAKDSVFNMQKLHELAQSQLFELRAQSDEERATKQSEVNLLMDEVEQAQTRLFSLEREKGFLRSKLQTANDDTESKKSDVDSTSVLENSLIAKEKIIAELNMELHNIERTLSNEREEHLNEIKRLNALLIEKAVGYNSIEAEDWEVATSGEEMSKMESLLLDKNRKMEHELTQLKVKLSEKASLLEKADGKISELTVKVNEQQKLIQKLEDDILKVSIDYSWCLAMVPRIKKRILFGDWDLSEARSTEPSENADQKHGSLDQDQSSMLKVICNQRDRFRTRMRETEEEIRHLKEKIGALTVELEKTKADNVKLYGKIRYVQDYSLQKVVSRESKKEIRQLKEKIGALTVELEKTKADNVKLYGKIRYVQDYSLEKVVSRESMKPADDLESGFSSDVESKYKKIYEDDINPFAAFSKKERDQRYKELGFRDRITLSSGRFLLGNK